MHTEIESGDGPERWHSGLLPPRLGGSFLPLLTGAEQGGWSARSRESRWRCGSIMGVQRGAGSRCGLISRGVVLYVGLACLVDLVASGWARGSVEGVRGVQESGYLNKGQREGVGRASARLS
jgi:hypothetical protein